MTIKAWAVVVSLACSIYALYLHVQNAAMISQLERLTTGCVRSR